MKDMMLLIKQNKGFYLVTLAFLAIFAVRGTMFLQINPVQRTEVYTIIVLCLLIPLTIGIGGSLDIRKKEFEEKLPVKKVFLEMSGYVVTIGIGAVCGLLSVVTSLWTDRGRAEGYRFAGFQGQEFACLFLEILTTITFFYLFILLFKKYVRGFCLALVCWIGAMTGMETYAFSSKGWFEKHTGVQMVSLAVVTFLMIVMMVLHSKYRELSKGKNCYFKVLDIGVILLLGYIVYNCFEWWIDRGKGISLLATGITVVAALWKEMRGERQSVSKLQVTSKKEVKHPFLSWEFGGFLLGGAILTLILLGSSAEMRRSAYANADFVTWRIDEVQNMQFHTEVIDSEMNFVIESELPWNREVKTAIMIVAFGLVFFVSLAREGERETRDFRERLPVSRREAYISKTLLQTVMFIAPLMLDMAVNAGCYISRAKEQSHIAEIYMLHARDSALWTFVLCGLIFTLLGVEKLMDAVVESLWLKQFNLVCIVFGFLAISIQMYPIRMDKSAFVPLMIAMIGSIAGLILMIIAGKLYERRDQARAFYYYKPALYVFTTFYSMLYAAVIGGTAYVTQNIVWCILALAGVVGVWWTSIHFCSPSRETSFVKK